jgi:chromosome segregation ATPase
LVSIGHRLNAASQNLSYLRERLSRLEELSTAANKSVDALRSDIGNLSAELDEIGSDLGLVKENIASIGSDQGLAGEVHDLRSTVNSLWTVIIVMSFFIVALCISSALLALVIRTRKLSED